MKIPLLSKCFMSRILPAAFKKQKIIRQKINTVTEIDQHTTHQFLSPIRIKLLR